MRRVSSNRWVAGAVAAAVLTLVAGTGVARADVTVERTMKSAGFAGFGAGDTTVTEKISGLRKRDVSTMKMTGFLGKMAGDLGGDEITDIAKDAVWRLDHKQKTYTESRITPPPAPKEEKGERSGREEQREKPNVRVVRNEITVKGPGASKNLNGFDCSLYTIVWVVETENLDTKERSVSTMTSDLWTTPETAETRALQQAEMEFTKAWLKKIGWDMNQQEAQKLGLAMVGAMIGGDEESFRKGAKEVAEKMAKIKGFPIGTGVKWQLQSSGGEAAAKPERGGEEMPDLPKGLGGLMAAFGKKSTAKGGGAGAADAGGANTVFDTYTEIRKISTSSLPDADFLPPAGYKKVE